MAALVITNWSIEASGVAPEQGGVFDRCAIGTKLELDIQYELTGDMNNGNPFECAGTQVYFNPALFTQVGQVWQPSNVFPINSFFVTIPSNSVASYPMVMQSGGGGSQFVVNGVATLSVINSREFSIKYDFYLTCDVQGFTLNQVVDVAQRLTATRATGDQFDNSQGSVYNGTRSLAWWTAAQGTDATIVTVNGGQNVRGNFYNQHVDGNFGQPSFEWRDIANNPIMGLSQYDDVKYRMTVPYTVAPAFVRVVAWRQTSVLNGTWEQSIDLLDFQLVNAPAGVTVYGGFFKQPSILTATGGVLTCEVTIDHTLVDPNESYFIAFIATYSAAEDGSQAFIDPVAYRAVQPPTPVGLDIISYFSNYNRSTGDIPNDVSGGRSTAAPGERIEDGVLLNRVNYDFDVSNAGYGAGFINDFLRFNMRVIDQNTNEVLYSASRERSPFGSFPDNDKVFSYGNLGDYYRIKWLHRIPSYTESNDRQDWTGRTLTIAWEFFFVYGDFTVRYTYAQELAVFAGLNRIAIDILNGSNGLPARDICNEDFLVVRVEQRSDTIDDGFDYNLIAILDREPFGHLFVQNGQMKEHESFNGTPAFVGNPPFERLEATEMFDVDVDFAPLDTTVKYAFFKIKVADLQEGVRYCVKPLQLRKP